MWEQVDVEDIIASIESFMHTRRMELGLLKCSRYKWLIDFSAISHELSQVD